MSTKASHSIWSIKTARIAVFTVLVGAGALLGSAQYSPAVAGWFGPDYGWMGNTKYMECLKYVGALSGKSYPGLDQNIQACKRNYLHGD
jgi:hypothetical protein